MQYSARASVTIELVRATTAKTLIYIIGEQQDTDKARLVEAFKDLKASFSTNAAPARGGYEFIPSLTVALKFTGELALVWFLSGVGSDTYKLLKRGVKNMLKVKPRRPPDWPKGFSDPKFCGLIIQIESPTHAFIIDFSIPSEESMIKAIDSLPSFLESLASNIVPTHHLIHWDGESWHLDLTQAMVW